MATRCPPMARFSIALVMPTTVWKMSRFATRWLYLIALRCSSRSAADHQQRWPPGCNLTLIGATGFLAVPAPNWLSWTDTRKPAVFLATGSIPVGAAGDQQHRVATALYEDLAQIVAMVQPR